MPRSGAGDEEAGTGSGKCAAIPCRCSCRLPLVPAASPPRTAPCAPAPRTPKGPLGPPGEAAKGKGGWRRCPGADIARAEPSDRQDKPPDPPSPPRQGIAGPALRTPPAGRRRRRRELQRLAKGPFKYIFSSPRVPGNIFPIETLCKGKSKKARNTEKRRGELPPSPPPFTFLAAPLGEGSYLSLHFSLNLENL